MKKPKIKKLIQVSTEVIKDCSLQNGAIVAANPDKSAYPPTVQNYGYVWIRDASYICISADFLGLRDIAERFFDWCLHRAEGFQKSGIFHNAYNVNGTIHGTLVSPTEPKVPKTARDRYIQLIHHGTQFQPDQNGSLLVAIGHHIKCFGIKNIFKYENLIQKTASGLSNSWKNGQFVLPCFDLWEERCLLPTQRRFHTYSLAMCIAGLRIAIELLGKKKSWLQTEKQMSQVFSELYSSDANLIPRTYTIGSENLRGKMKKEDFLPDASLLGLVYPSGILEPTDKKMQMTIRDIIRRNTIDNGGLLRYPGDRYCGGVKNGWVTLTGAGAWPLLSFWMAIYFCLRGDTKNAGKYFYRPIERIEKYIPEQILKDKKKSSICPLVWSHSMFVIAANFMGYL
jgi:GH15 family glucan-1,4-alpha-glucosidase